MIPIAFALNNVVQTGQFGMCLGRNAGPGDVICLDGDLGAGKTTLSQAVAKGLGVDEGVYVTSPSFAIMHEYPGRCPIYHMDFYRLHDSSEIEDLGFDEYFYAKGVCLIEWAQRGADLIPRDALCLKIEINDMDTRVVHASTGSEDWRERLLKVIRECGLQMIDS